MSPPFSSISLLHATGRSLIPGTVVRTISKSPARSSSSSTTDRPMSQRANVVSATPIRLRRLAFRLRLGIAHPLQLCAQRVVLRDLRDDLPRPVQVADELRKPDDPRVVEPPRTCFVEDPRLVVRLVEPERDHVGSNLGEDVVDVPLVAEGGAAHGL